MSTRTDRVELMLRVTHMPDPLDLMTWKVDDRELTADELRLLHAMTVADAADTVALMSLWQELIEASNREEWGGAS